MRIAFLTTEYPTEHMFAGGLASYLRRVGLALMQQGHEVELFCLSHCDEVLDDAGIMVHRVKKNNRLISKLGRMPILWRYGGYIETLVPAVQLSMRLRNRHRGAPFDVVQASSYRACGVASVLFQQVPLVTRISSYEPLMREGYQKPLTNRQRQVEILEMLQIRRSAATYAPSNLIAEVILKHEEIPIATIEPPFFQPGLDNEIDVKSLFSLPEAYAMFFGSIGTLKGCDRLLDVLPDLLRSNSEMGFVFVGDAKKLAGRPFDAVILETLSAYRGRVRVLPPLKHEQLFPIVAGARLVVLPSRVDNLPNACMEAMSLGRVVVGTLGASFDQLITHGHSGFLVSQEDDCELAATIEFAWKMADEERVRIGENAKEVLRRMEPAKAAAKLATFFEGIIRRP